MNDHSKTLVFVAAALLMAAVAWGIRSSGPQEEVAGADVGKPLFADFTDPLKAVRLEVVDFDEKTGEAASFAVAQVNGAWVIPSHEGYPADAFNRMASASSELVGLKKLGIVSDESSEHAEFGVKNPEEAKQGDVGVGRLIRLRDAAEAELVRLIIGKEVKDKKGLHYVRVPSQDRVYVTQVSLSNLTTKFEDWVEKDFLDLSGWDLKKVTLDNYSVQEIQTLDGLSIRLVPGEKHELAYDGAAMDEKQRWKFAGELAEGEELNVENLNALRTAVDDLKIISVNAKSEVFRKNLSEGRELFKLSDLRDPNNTALQEQFVQTSRSLAAKGFFMVPVKGEEEVQVYSNQGQVFVDVKDGVQYVLRFGEVVDPAGQASAESEQKSSRYLYVVARFNEAALEKPALENLPEIPEDLKKEIEQAKAEAEADKKELAPPTVADIQARAPADAQRQLLKSDYLRIQSENDRRQKEHASRIAQSKERVSQLNGRFAPWYYVISDEMYHQIRLGRSQIVKKKEEPKDPAAGLDAGKNAAAAAAFLEENKKKEGVITTASGLQYQVLAPGSGGKKPAAASRVQVRYKGSLLDGTVFDQSGETPAEFPVNGVIKGWTEALQLMEEGAKWKLFVPSSLAYGANAPPGSKIGPDAMLIFEVELLKVLD